MQVAALSLFHIEENIDDGIKMVPISIPSKQLSPCYQHCRPQQSSSEPSLLSPAQRILDIRPAQQILDIRVNKDNVNQLTRSSFLNSLRRDGKDTKHFKHYKR